MNREDWLLFDKEHVWHPYSSLTRPSPVYAVTSAEGVYLQLANGNKLIDAMASWWCVIHGYNHPVLNQALQKQIDKMSHVMFGGLTHQTVVELAKLLVDITPKSLETVFFCDSGSVSVEVAIKMALQYWYAKGEPQKQKLLTIRNGYHGDTFGAMSVCDPVNGMHNMFSHVLPKHYFAEAPECKTNEEWKDEDIQSFKSLLEAHHKEIATVILEPLLQGAGGMRMYCSEYLRQVKSLCTKYDVLLVFDEIATGFARTGSLFASDKAKVIPDIMCLGKALTGGYMSLAATMTTQKIAETISDNSPGVFMHGPTFMGNPLACSVALASIRLLLESPWQERISQIEKQLKESLSVCRKFSHVADVRVLGAVGVVELVEPPDIPSIQKRFVDMGVWIRPFRNLIYIMPPYIIQPEELEKVCQAIVKVITEYEK